MPSTQKMVKKTVRQAKKAGTYKKGLGQATRAKLQSESKKSGSKKMAPQKLSASAPLPRAGVVGRKLPKSAPVTRTAVGRKKRAY